MTKTCLAGDSKWASLVAYGLSGSMLGRIGLLPVKLWGSDAPSNPSEESNWANPNAPKEKPDRFMKDLRLSKDRPIGDIFSS